MTRIARWAITVVTLLTCSASVSPAHAQWSSDGVYLQQSFHGFFQCTGWREPSVGLRVLITQGGHPTPFRSSCLLSETGESLSGLQSIAEETSSPLPDPPLSISDGASGLLSIVDGSTFAPLYFVHTPPVGANAPWVSLGDSVMFPGIASDGAGGALVTGFRKSGSWGMKVRRVRSDGTPAPGWSASWTAVGPGTPVVNATTDDGLGGLVAVWFGPSFSLVAKRITGSGAAAAGWPAGGLEFPIYWDLLKIFRSGDGWFLTGLSASNNYMALRFRLDGTMDPAWPDTGITVLAGSYAPYRVVLDGQGGLWMSCENGGPRVNHLTAGGTFAPGFGPGGKLLLPPDAQYAGGFGIASSLNGGLLYAWSDQRPAAPGLRVGWRLADGSPDPSEPDSGRIIVAGGTVFVPNGAYRSVVGVIDDGNGGGYLGWRRYEFLVDSLFLNRIVHTAVLDVSPRDEVAMPAQLSISPNPASRAFSARFALGSAEPARLELLDLAGRRVATRDVGGVGEHVERFDDLGALPPGVYLVRLAHGHRLNFSRVALVH